MTEPGYRTLIVERTGHVLHVQLNRPEVHNALDGETIEELTRCFASIRAGGRARAVLLSGAGRSFCAGADLSWMRRVAGFGLEENLRDARSLSDLLAAIDDCPAPTVARVHGAVLGGGTGLAACCDVVIAAEDARFGFTEAKLGILPAVISPFVVAKIGESHARALFATGERFGAHRALLIGLAHVVVPAAQLDDTVDRQVQELLTSAPGAASEAKRLIAGVRGRPPSEVGDYTSETIARLRAGDEGTEGIAAFLEKRRPSWVESDG